jgi:phosphate starvation-inducible protein PhoH
MTAIEKRVTLDNVDMLSLLGTNDTNLKLIEDRFNASITVRGDNVIMKGVPEEVDTV